MGRTIMITYAITGSSDTPAMSAYLPVTRRHIAAEAIAEPSSGAAVPRRAQQRTRLVWRGSDARA